MGKPGRAVALLLAAAALLAVGYSLGRGSAPTPADLPPAPAAAAPAPAPPGEPDPVEPQVEELQRQVARLQDENASLRAAAAPPPERLDREALDAVSRGLDERFAGELAVEHPELQGLVDEYERTRSDMVAAPDGPRREALVARVAELRARVNRIREPYRKAADHTKLLLERAGRRVGLTADQMRRLADFAYPRWREVEGLQVGARERLAALRKAHPEIERSGGWGEGEDAMPKYRDLEPDLDRALSRIQELVLDYHATWKGMLTGEQRARLGGAGR